MSSLAVVSAVFLVVPLVGPLVSLVLGAMAMGRINESQGRLRGRRLALASLLTAGVLLVGESWILERTLQGVMAAIQSSASESVERVFGATDGASARAALAGWSDREADRIVAEDVEAFAAAARHRYGAFRSLSMMNGDQSGGTFERQVVTYAVVFRFEEGDRLGSILLLLEPGKSRILPEGKLVEIAIDDRDHGDLVLKPRIEETNP